MLPSTEASLLDWSINLMADVVEMEHVKKMNARNIAMVFAPNMTQDRKESRDRLIPGSNPSPRDENGDQTSRQLVHLMEANMEVALDDTFEVEMKDKEDSAEEEEYAEPREILGVKSEG
ncbi:unnamed protein product [Brassica rapa]|uniref:BnaA05g27570D protein n=2 Tax=Brassica TaxID=3705 RepID=A0A078F576_BRANA|nr:unnamed protein product [Brassica rapa]CDY08521.1 BnaA05g27570D [Brassica napus]VDC72866.1 unnamed protein product [Brassica rapa]